MFVSLVKLEKQNTKPKAVESLLSLEIAEAPQKISSKPSKCSSSVFSCVVELIACVSYEILSVRYFRNVNCCIPENSLFAL